MVFVEAEVATNATTAAAATIMNLGLLHLLLWLPPTMIHIVTANMIMTD